MEIRDKQQTTEINLGLGVPGLFSAFTHSMALTLQIIAVGVGVPSTICGLINILLITNLHGNHFRYRHTLLTITFTLNFFKCLFYTLYSFLQLSSYNIYDMPVAYNVLGFLTHMMITSCDSMALFLTLHFAVLIFKPKLGIYSKDRHIFEGGLYMFRYYVYAFTIFYSLLSSSLAFINIDTSTDFSTHDVTISKTKGLGQITHTSKLGGYKPYATIISLPVSPYYYGLVCSWLYRYVVLLCIIGVSLAIYVNYLYKSMKIRKRLKNLSKGNSDIENQIEMIRLDFSNMVVDQFEKSQQKTKRQLNTIYLYPSSYFLLWLILLIENIEQKFHDKKHGPIIPITIIATICHPANCLFDICIFFINEKPIKYSWANYQKNLIINHYLKPQNLSALSVEDKCYLLQKTSTGQLKWYYSKEVNKLIADGHLETTKDTNVQIPTTTKMLHMFYHILPFRRAINLDEIHYETNKPDDSHQKENANANAKSITSRSVRSFNLESNLNSKDMPHDPWVLNVLNEASESNNNDEQYSKILNDVHLADSNIELESNLTANDDTNNQSDEINSKLESDDRSKDIDINDFLNT